MGYWTEQEGRGSCSEPAGFGISRDPLECACPWQGKPQGTRARAGRWCALRAPVLAQPCCRPHLVPRAGDSGDIPAQPCGAPGPSWVGSDPTDLHARPAHPLAERSRTPLPAGAAAEGSRAELPSRLPFPGPCVIPGSGSEFIQLLARVSSAPSAAARLTGSVTRRRPQVNDDSHPPGWGLASLATQCSKLGRLGSARIAAVHLNISAHQELEMLPGAELAAPQSSSLEERGQ